MAYNIFVYDKVKSASNQDKHGIDFELAQTVWLDKDALIATAKHIEDEKRYMIVGKIKERIWAVIFTHRQDSIRIISARKARKEEVNYYEKNKS